MATHRQRLFAVAGWLRPWKRSDSTASSMRPDFPHRTIRFCLKEAGLTLAEIDHVSVPRNPYARLATKILYALRMPSFARERAKVLVKFQGIPEALAQAFEVAWKNARQSR